METLDLNSCSTSPVFGSRPTNVPVSLEEVVGAVHLHGPTYRFPGDRRQKAETAVVDAAGRIADGLGLSSLDAADPDGDPEAPTPNR